ncbi:MAG: LacI family DNA-binding transcriptional regulator [Solirubrobacteraceae bacterium]
MSCRVTLRHVADEVGVSAKTVSNAFSRPDQLSSALRARVLAAADALGYAGPDPVAAGLRRGRVGALGVAYANSLSYAFDDPVSVELLAGITSVAERADTGLLLVPGSVTPERAAAAVRAAVIDGLVASSLADDDPVLHAALRRRLPLVVVDQPGPETLGGAGAAPPWVGIDDRSAAAAVARHLLELGHRRLAVVSFGLSRATVRGPADERAQRSATLAVTRRRLAGCRDAVEAAGLDWSRVPVVAGTDSTPAEGATAAATALASTPRPTALLCLSDRLAEGAVAVATRLGLRIPRDLSIAGFDGSAPSERLGLTTVRQPHRRKGEEAARALLALLAGGTPAPRLELPAELVVRASTAALGG